MGEDDIFDDFELTDEERKKVLKSREGENEHQKISDVSAKVISDETKKEETTFADKEKHPKEVHKPKVRVTNRKVLAVIGLGLFVGVGVLIYLSLTGMIVVTDDDTFDSSKCEYGTVSEFFGKRCITVEESFEEFDNDIQEQTGNVIPSTPIKQVPSATEKPDGYYSITTTDSWYGDYIDGSEVPRKIDLNDRARVEFSCYVDEHLGTSVYFGTFRNNVENDLTVEVYIGGLEANSKTTESNKALILEGSCYGHES